MQQLLRSSCCSSTSSMPLRLSLLGEQGWWSVLGRVHR
jgi:hypothetical protein